ncbi:MAG: hypothetical protein PHR92_15345 [Lachnospiraceae bacterium]|nr:hypothetical protein [Lachnospiraceae bacterium]
MKTKQMMEIIYDGRVFEVKQSKIIDFLLKIFHTNRKHKDRLFVKLFDNREALLELYNAVNGSNYKNPGELVITTLEDAVYMGMKNDCSFLIGSHLNLYEHQSTFNPNMPLRGFLYFASALQGYLAVNQINIYSRYLVKLPTPQYIVFYNGTEDYPDRIEQRLSDAFEKPGGCMEFRAVMLNINLGHNSELMEQCRLLEEYSIFIDKIRDYLEQKLSTEDAVDAASQYCIENDILKQFLLKNRNEVRQLILTEYNEKKHMEMERRDERAEGIREGKFAVAKLMLERGETIEYICEITELSREEIETALERRK